jgi:hypothetical protein
MQAKSTEYSHLWNIYSHCKQEVKNILTFGIFMVHARRKYITYSPLEYCIYGQCKQKVQNILTFGIFMFNASRKYRIFSPLEYLWSMEAESTEYTHLWNIYGHCKQKVPNILTFGIFIATACRKYRTYLWSLQIESTEHTHLWNTVFIANESNILTFGIFMATANRNYREYSHLWNIYSYSKQEDNSGAYSNPECKQILINDSRCIWYTIYLPF